ncbi:hypothetical protein [Paenibacillus sp. MDMC362]|uniref:hypothetical protein n=1 Tax=Paenibacillus sp. MDMC362 TaxID=2977365 RepID=UPI000DC1FC41|nr:hypothetical protein [Paenibacillus sp. MDMC362]RAR39661.1 hypothetical protein DP091_29690 [Paenibacillus sp. MDMC362]
MSRRRRTRYRRANVEVTQFMSPLDLIDRFMPLASKEVHIGMQGDEELALIAGVHEYGSVKMNIPARSFVGTGKKKGQVPIGKLVRKSLTDIAIGKMRAETLLQEIGELGLDRMQKNFDRIKQPGLSPIYARRKSGKKLLIEDQDLRNALTFEVTRKRR